MIFRSHIQTKFRQNLDTIQMNLDKIQTKFRPNLDIIQTELRCNLNEFRTQIQTKFRQNLDKIQTKFRQNLDEFRTENIQTIQTSGNLDNLEGVLNMSKFLKFSTAQFADGIG